MKDAKWLIFFFILVFAGVGAWVSTQYEPFYKATTSIVVTQPVANSPSNERAEQVQDDLTFYATQSEILRSRTLLISLIEALDLRQRYLVDSSLLDSPSLLRRALFPKPILQAVLPAKDSSTDGLLDDDKALNNALVKKLQHAMNIDRGNDSQVFNVSFAIEDADFARLLSAELARLYSEFALEANLQALENAQAWRRKTENELLSKVENAQQRLAILRQQYQQLTTQSTPQQQKDEQEDTQPQTLQTAVFTQNDYDQQVARFQQLQAGDLSAVEFYNFPQAQQDAVVSSLLEKRAELETQFEFYFARYKEKHPKMIAARQALSDSDEALFEESKAFVTRLEQEIVDQTISETSQEVDQSSPTITAEFLLQSIQDTQEELARHQDMYQAFIEQGSSATAQSDKTVPNIQILDNDVNAQMIQPHPAITVMLYACIGAMVGAVIGAIKQRWFNKINTNKQLSDKLGLRSLGRLELRANKANLTLPELKYLRKPHSNFVKSIDAIRSQILSHQVDSQPQLILISSANKGEGKSTLALNLAASFGQLGKTLLIDLNLRQPCIGEALRMPPYSGLTDVLTNALNIREAIFKVVGTNDISVLSAGTHTNEPLNIIKSAKFFALLASLKNEYETIVLDAPNILTQPDIDYLLPEVDGVVLTARAGQTRLSELQQALKHLKMHHANIIGAVLLSRMKKIASKQKQIARAYQPSMS